jgi:hypothetical protein
LIEGDGLPSELAQHVNSPAAELPKH